jgi:hypothetical protein
MHDPLRLRGAINILHRAIRHAGRGYRTDEWGAGSYLNPAVEEADHILTKAVWDVAKEFRDTYEVKDA